jgi:hypothetical protein
LFSSEKAKPGAGCSSAASSSAARQDSLSEAKKEFVLSNGSQHRHIAAQTFTFRELAAATNNFRADCLLGEGGFGRVYKGYLESVNQVRFLPSRYPASKYTYIIFSRIVCT